MLDDTVVVITSDHGESFGQHGLYGHNRSVWNALVQIPLVILVPGGRSERIRHPVSLTDVHGTVLELTGVGAGPTVFEPRPVVSEFLAMPHQRSAGWQRAWVDGDRKLMLGKRGGQRLFDREGDPDERLDLSGEEPDVADRMRADLEAWIDAHVQPDGQSQPAEWADGHLEQLEALGYVE